VPTIAGPAAAPETECKRRLRARGLDALMASGSEQPSLSELAGVIRGFGENVVVVDLRQDPLLLASI